MTDQSDQAAAPVAVIHEESTQVEETVVQRPLPPAEVETTPIGVAPASNRGILLGILGGLGTLLLIGLIVLVVVLSLNFIKLNKDDDQTKQSPVTPRPVAVVATETAEVPRPWYPKDASNWTAWVSVSKENRDVLSSMMEKHGAMYNKSIDYLLQEETRGKTFAKTLKKGTRVWEVFYGDDGNDGKYKWGWYTLKEDTTFLVFPDGTIAFDVTCGNTAVFEKQPAKAQAPQRTTRTTRHHRVTTRTRHRRRPPSPPKYCTNGGASTGNTVGQVGTNANVSTQLGGDVAP